MIFLIMLIKNIPSEQLESNFTIRKDAFVYYRKQTEFKQYDENLYCDLKIKDFFISKKYLADAVLITT